MDYLVKKMWQEAREFRKHFGVRPGKVFIEIKVENILKYMAAYPEEKNYCICLEFGFANEKALYKFLKRNTQKTPTKLRKGITKRDNESVGLRTCYNLLSVKEHS